jgi:hypothetical protein
MYNTLTITQFVNHFNKALCNNPHMVSHATKLLNHRSLHELLQHAQTVYNIPNPNNGYYHISDAMVGYDSFFFNKANFQKILFGNDIGLITFHEKKMVMGNAESYNKMVKIIDKYSLPKGLDTGGNGCRPAPVGQLEFGSLTTENHDIINRKLENITLCKNINVIRENYSDFFAQIEINLKHGGFLKGYCFN